MLCKFLRMSNDMPSPNAAEATVSTCENKLDELYRQTVAMVSFTQRVKPEKLRIQLSLMTSIDMKPCPPQYL